MLLMITAAAVGAGLASDGYTSLPVRSGATIIYVNNGRTCSDANPGTDPTKPKCTVRGGVATIPKHTNGEDGQGRGDQILVAEGTKYAENIPINGRQFGYSAKYPTVIQSYDPAKPTDQTRWGRAGTTGHGARPQVKEGWGIIYKPSTGSAERFCGLAIRGFDVTGLGASASPDQDCFLIENNRFTGVFITVGGNNVSIRRNSFNGGAPDAGGYKAQNIYGAGKSLLIERNVINRGGWPLGKDRSCSSDKACTPNMYNHNIYLHVTATDAIIRDNMIVDASAQGLQLRGGGWVSGNVFIDNPIAMTLGGGVGTECATAAKTNMHRVWNNIFIGVAERLNATQSPKYIFSVLNGLTGSYVRDNLIIDSPYTLNAAKVNACDGTGKTGVVFKGNIVDNVPLITASKIYVIPAAATAKRYSTAQIYAALGFASKDAFMKEAVAHPEIDWASRFRFLNAAYGVSTS